MKKERNDGFEDYLLGKIVNNQKEVLGERAPRFYENNNNQNHIINQNNRNKYIRIVNNKENEIASQRANNMNKNNLKLFRIKKLLARK